MKRGPFVPRFEDLPQTLAIFPLSGVLLLPRGKLPLNIFEPRYLAMTEDAMKGDRLIGMVQPMEEGAAGDQPPVFPVGCAGRITQFAETEDGRYLITLTGLCRFRIERELPLFCGYRRVVPDFSGFEADLKPESGALDRSRLLAALRTYLKLQKLSADWESIEGAPDERLITSLAMICPFSCREKQALLESTCLTERARVLTSLLEMAVLESAGAGPKAQPH
jgi:Lon protease-like protein